MITLKQVHVWVACVRNISVIGAETACVYRIADVQTARVHRLYRACVDALAQRAALLGKAPTPKGALLPQRIVSYKYLSVQLHS